MKALLSIVLLLIIGCTVTPLIVRTPEISFDEGVQNGGFLGYTTNHEGVITAAAKVRYDRVVAKFGSNSWWLVPIQVGDGLTPYTNGTWLIDAEHNRKAQTMFRWQKQKTAP